MLQLLPSGSNNGSTTYKVVFEPPCTVEMFIQFVLEERKTETGVIKVTKNDSLHQKFSCRYSKGKLCSSPLNDEILAMPITFAEATGALSRMDYCITI